MSITLSTVATAAWVAVLVGVAAVVATVFTGRAGSMPVGPALAALVVLVLARSGCLALAEVAAQEAASSAKAAHRVRLGGLVRGRRPADGLVVRSGELVHVVTADVDRLDGYVARFLPARATAVTAPLLIVVVIAAIDPLTLPILLFAGPLLVILLGLIGRTTAARTRRRERELAWLDGHFLDMIRGLPTLRLFGRSHEQADAIERVARQLAASSLDVLRTAFQTSLVLEWGATAATALVAIAVSVRLLAGDLAFDRALAVLLLTPECFVPVRRLASHYHTGAAGRTALESIEALEGVAVAVAPGARPDPVPGLPAPPAIRIAGLTVAYPGSVDPVLADASFTVGAGRLTVLAGATGAGKSTLASVLLRFLEPEAGTVDVDGASLASIDASAWRRRLAWLPQHPHLFDGTLASNLRLARPEATDDELRHVLEAAAASGLLASLPDGLDTRVGEDGARLSGGEVSRVAFARALLRGAPLLVVDEPTAHLDPASAAIVRATLAGRRGATTILAISHDPLLAELADEVLVVERGRVVPLVDEADLAMAPR